MTDTSTLDTADPPVAPAGRAPWWSAPRTGLAAVAIGLACAVVVVGAGFDLAHGGWQQSLRLLGALVLAGLVVHGLTSAVVWAIARRRARGWRLRGTTSLLALPIALLLALAARVAGIEPGLAFVASLTCGTVAALPRGRATAAVVARAAVALATGLSGWLAYSTLVHHSASAFVRWGEVLPDQRLRVAGLLDTATVVGAETFAAIAVVACTAALVWLLPAFDGAVLWRTSPILWAGVYAMTCVPALLVVVPPTASVWGRTAVVLPFVILALTGRMVAVAEPAPDAGVGPGL